MKAKKETIKNEHTKVFEAYLSAEQLKTLDGIGDATAQKIIDYRNEKGNFGKIEDIKNVSGIGESKYNKIKDKIII